MTEMNADQMTGTISISVSASANGQYICQMSSTLSDREKEDIQCCGQTQEHAIAIALEKLACKYRSIAEEQQTVGWDAVERTETGEPIEKRYHVILHYEDIVQTDSKFWAKHDTMLGNTIVESAKFVIIEIADDLPIELP